MVFNRKLIDAAAKVTETITSNYKSMINTNDKVVHEPMTSNFGRKFA